MHDMIELAIEREAAILDAAFEGFDDLFDLPPAPLGKAQARLNPYTRKFSSRTRPRGRATARTTTSSAKYLN